MKNNLLKYIPIALPTENPIFPCIAFGSEELGWRYTDHKMGASWVKYYNMFFVSDREIKEGDLVIITYLTLPKYKGPATGPIKWDKSVKSERGEFKRIEASTDSSLGLPIIPQKFVEEWAEKRGKIKETYLQMKEIYSDYGEGAKSVMHFDYYKIQTNNKNEVIIFPVKDSWNRKDMSDAFNAGYAMRNDIEINGLHSEALNFDEWFDKNY